MKKMRSKISISLLSFTVISLVIYYFFPEQELPKNAKIDFIKISKSNRELTVFSKGKALKTFTVSLGREPIGKKQISGDNKTPEGVYFINGKNPYSDYHKNLGISYPNKHDLKNAQKLKKSPGGDIKIHGLPNNSGYVGKFHRWIDWTAGCIAVTNEEIDELFDAVKINTKVIIEP